MALSPCRWVIMVVAPVAVLASARAEPGQPTSLATLRRIDALVTEHFYAPERLASKRWPEQVERARKRLKKGEPSRLVFADLLASLETSHTGYYGPSDPHLAGLVSIYDRVLALPDRRCAKRHRVRIIRRATIGVWWHRDQEQGRAEAKWFVGGVFAGGPADKAGLHLGDRVETADGVRFDPVRSLAGKGGKTVRLGVRRTEAGPIENIAVVPRRRKPSAMIDALAKSARIIESGDQRIAYLRVWSWAGDEAQAAVEDAIGRLNQERPTGFVVDLRDGWGGASPSYLRIFDRRPPRLTSNPRGQPTRIFDDPHIRVPAVLLINGGSRSGKEVIAYGAKKHGLATLVGETTAGAVVAGTVYCLPDGAVLYLAVAAVTVDGEVLEGVGVAPDIEVPFDLRWANGTDAQLEAALRHLTRATA